jgi:hypothetical protein
MLKQKEAPSGGETFLVLWIFIVGSLVRLLEGVIQFSFGKTFGIMFLYSVISFRGFSLLL